MTNTCMLGETETERVWCGEKKKIETMQGICIIIRFKRKIKLAIVYFMNSNHSSIYQEHEIVKSQLQNIHCWAVLYCNVLQYTVLNCSCILHRIIMEFRTWEGMVGCYLPEEIRIRDERSEIVDSLNHIIWRKGRKEEGCIIAYRCKE